jgi:hypothetical protein
MILKPVFTVLQCSGLKVQPTRIAETYCLVMKPDERPRRAEREAKLSVVNESTNGMSTPQKVEAESAEPGLPDEEAWEKERKTALAQIQNALKFCVHGYGE